MYIYISPFHWHFYVELMLPRRSSLYMYMYIEVCRTTYREKDIRSHNVFCESQVEGSLTYWGDAFCQSVHKTDWLRNERRATKISNYIKCPCVVVLQSLKNNRINQTFKSLHWFYLLFSLRHDAFIFSFDQTLMRKSMELP